jgi:hypothetical protein
MIPRAPIRNVLDRTTSSDLGTLVNLVFLGRDAKQQHSARNLRFAYSWMGNSLLRFLSITFQVFGPYVLGFPFFHNTHQHDLLWVAHLIVRV